MKNYNKETIERLIVNLEKCLEEAETLSKQNNDEPRFQLAFEVGYLRGSVKSALIDLKHLKL